MKVILAIDPFEHELSLHEHILEELRPYVSDLSDIRPVYIFSGFSDSSIPTIIEETNKRLPQQFKEFFAPIRVLFTYKDGHQKSAEKLSLYADEQGADFIALLSLKKRDLQSKIFGGFSEALLARSTKPLLFLPEFKNTSQSNKALFATDFSNSSEAAFKKFLKHIKPKTSELILFHAIQLPQFATAGPIYAQALDLLPQNYWIEQEAWAQKRAKELEVLAQAENIKLKVIIQNQVSSVEVAIYKVMQSEQVSLLGASSTNTALHRLLLGSVSKSLLKNRELLLWVCGPQVL